MEKKINIFKSSPIAKDLRVLAEGAEEMRVLGSILSINKGLKATVSETEAFIDTIENLIYDRKLAMGWEGSETDKVDFHKFVTSKKYQEEVIEKYEKVKDDKTFWENIAGDNEFLKSIGKEPINWDW